MSKRKNTLKKINYFDMLDAELLEQYLSKMALEGWMISKIGNIFFTFEKINPKVIRFFVDITTKDLVGDNYTPIKDYINSYKEKNLEHVCGSNEFQIFINNSNEKNIERRKLKFTKVFERYPSVLLNIMISALSLFTISIDTFGEPLFMKFISNNMHLILVTTFILVAFGNIIMFTLQLSKYMQVVKKDNKNFDVKRNFNIRLIIERVFNFIFVIFFMIAILILMDFDGGKLNSTSKDNIPLTLEDFNIDIQEDRECEISYSSSYFAKYSTYSDSTYENNYEEIYDEETDSYDEETSEENSAYLSYSVFESKYDKIINKALKSILKQYDEYEYDYKKINNTQEVKNWGAKEVYINSFFNEKIIVYDYVIIKITGDIDYNKENIDLIKSKILKEIATNR